MPGTGVVLTAGSLGSFPPKSSRKRSVPKRHNSSSCATIGSTINKQKTIPQNRLISEVLQQGLRVEVVTLDVFEVVEGSHFEFLASRLIADDDTMLVHL